jgi:hypothetical protein
VYGGALRGRLESEGIRVKVLRGFVRVPVILAGGRATSSRRIATGGA